MGIFATIINKLNSSLISIKTVSLLYQKQSQLLLIFIKIKMLLTIIIATIYIEYDGYDVLLNILQDFLNYFKYYRIYFH